jgi:FtsH-binding integral membrane protein
MKDKIVEHIVYILAFILEYLPLVVFLLYATKDIMLAIVLATITYFFIDHFTRLTDDDIEYLNKILKEEKND